MIQVVALGVAGADADYRVRETDGANRSPRIREYVANLEPPMAPGIPYCAAAVQKWSDVASWITGIPNPLDAVRHEALVQSYHDELAPRAVVHADLAEPGDLVLFRFSAGPNRWNHIGLLARKPNAAGIFWTVEANTSPGVGASDDEAQRDGDGVHVKPRELSAGYPVEFLRWHAPGTWNL